MHPLQVLFILMFLILCTFGVLEGASRLRRHVVKRSTHAAPDHYVTNNDEATLSRLLSPQTDQTPDQTDAAPPKFERDQLLTHYRWLRSLNASREDARRHLKAMGIPLDNNLWAEAAPARQAPQFGDDEEIVTPFAGRRTKAAYYPEEPDLEYQAPA